MPFFRLFLVLPRDFESLERPAKEPPRLFLAAEIVDDKVRSRILGLLSNNFLTSGRILSATPKVPPFPKDGTRL